MNKIFISIVVMLSIANLGLISAAGAVAEEAVEEARTNAANAGLEIPDMETPLSTESLPGFNFTSSISGLLFVAWLSRFR